mmetsp:Transcript_25907/g.35963  ORF Transcript_25907/g.35963 Transcript_25907/m.35963 type:complete len:300 (-) Transcript_25907:788-1687(-)
MHSPWQHFGRILFAGSDLENDLDTKSLLEQQRHCNQQRCNHENGKNHHLFQQSVDRLCICVVHKLFPQEQGLTDSLGNDRYSLQNVSLLQYPPHSVARSPQDKLGFGISLDVVGKLALLELQQCYSPELGNGALVGCDSGKRILDRQNFGTQELDKYVDDKGHSAQMAHWDNLDSLCIYDSHRLTFQGQQEIGSQKLGSRSVLCKLLQSDQQGLNNPEWHICGVDNMCLRHSRLDQRNHHNHIYEHNKIYQFPVYPHFVCNPPLGTYVVNRELLPELPQDTNNHGLNMHVNHNKKIQGE